MSCRLTSHALVVTALLASSCASPPLDGDEGAFEVRMRASASALGLDPEQGTLDVFLAFEASMLLDDFDADADGQLRGEEVSALLDDLGDELGPATRTKIASRGTVELEDLWNALRELESAAAFEIDGDVATMAGTIDGTTPDRVAALVAEHPDVRSIVMRDVPGSVNDEANLEAARKVREAGLSTHLLADSVIASGGTDFFLAGAVRTIEPGARVGVHSWGGGEEEALDLPRDHEAHRPYLDYYGDMGVPADFYWFTLEAAPADGIHWMTEAELEAFHFEVLGEEP